MTSKPAPKRRKPTPEDAARLAEYHRQEEETGRARARRAVEIGPDKGGVDMLRDFMKITSIYKMHGLLHELLTMAKR